MDYESGVDKILINSKLIPFDKDEEEGHFEYTYKGLEIGHNIIEVKAVDKSGNEKIKQIEITFEVEDKIPPIIELINPAQESVYTNKDIYQIEGMVYDNESGIFRVKVNNEILDLVMKEALLIK